MIQSHFQVALRIIIPVTSKHVVKSKRNSLGKFLHSNTSPISPYNQVFGGNMGVW